MPRRVCPRSINAPVYSVGVIISRRTYGSKISWNVMGSGSFAGVSMSCSSRSSPLRMILYTTDGAVMIKSKSYSRSKRSCTMSMCRRPKKPHRKPNPMAVEVSGM